MDFKTPAGRIFGRFQILHRLGAGSYARVYYALMTGEHGFSKPVALKVIDVTVDEDMKDEARALINEAHLVGRLRHPNIIDMYDFGIFLERPYLAMEYIDGADLAKVLKRLRKMGGRIPTGIALRIAAAVARALDHAHTARDPETDKPMGVVHRDLKPHNVMLSLSNEVKILDFGIAASAFTLYQSTKPNRAKGTPAYMSPEQVVGTQRTDHRSDLFSFGVILLELLTNRHPFRSRTLPGLFHAILSRDLEPQFDELHAVCPHVEPVARRLLQRDRDDRYAVSAEVVEELEAACALYPPEGEIADLVRLIREIQPESPWERSYVPAEEIPGNEGPEVVDISALSVDDLSFAELTKGLDLDQSEDTQPGAATDPRGPSMTPFPYGLPEPSDDGQERLPTEPIAPPAELPTFADQTLTELATQVFAPPAPPSRNRNERSGMGRILRTLTDRPAALMTTPEGRQSLVIYSLIGGLAFFLAGMGVAFAILR